MSNSGKPASGAFPFMTFPIPGFGSASGAPAMSSGADLLKTLWGNIPGSSQVPGFLVPTLDVDELDKRLTDLKAAESWVEVNLNMLRATIQGLEVQRHTIAALKSMAVTPSSSPSVSPPPSPSPVPAATENPFVQTPPPTVEAAAPSETGLAAGSWLTYMQEQFTKVAEAALSAGGAAATKGKTPDDGQKPKSKPASRVKSRGGKPRVVKS